MNNEKPLVCVCCNKSYTMPVNLVPTTIKPWSKFGVCAACDTVVITGRLLDDMSSVFAAFEAENDATKISAPQLTIKENEDGDVSVTIGQEVTVVKKPVAAVVLNVLQPAMKATQLSLFDSYVIKTADALF